MTMKKNEKVCEQCKKTFKAIDYPTRKRRFCSKKCAGLFHRKKKIIKKCSICGKEFETIKERRVYCSKKCSNKAISIKTKGVARKKFRMSWGYKYLFLPEHPHCTKQGYVAEHRIIAERKIGRYLTTKEVVHHKNKKRNDNREENLEVMTKSEHHKLHAIERNKRAARLQLLTKDKQ